MPKKEFFSGRCPVVLFEKDQKDISFSLAQRKEVKETSTYPKSFPIWKDLTVQAGRPAFTDFSEVKSTIKGRFWFLSAAPDLHQCFSELFLCFFCTIFMFFAQFLCFFCAAAERKTKMTFDGHFYLNVLCKNAVFPFLQLIPSPLQARGWGVVEVPSYEEGVGVDGGLLSNALLKGWKGNSF